MTKPKTVSVEVLPATGKMANNAILKTGNDAAIAKQLNKLFADAQTGMRKIVALGLFAWEVKETQLKHGEFGAWLAQHCPKLATIDANGKPHSSRALRGYMDLTKNVLEAVGFPTIEKYLAEAAKFGDVKSLKHGGFLLIADKKVPEEVKPLREKICELVDGKTQRSLFSEFKQADDDASEPKRGRLPNCKGTTKEQRLAAEQREEQARIEALGMEAEEQTTWALEKADDHNLGTQDDKTLIALRDAWQNGAAYINQVLAGRGKKSAVRSQNSEGGEQ